jgi:hypothetical protein
VWQLRFIGRWLAVIFGATAWLIAVPIIEIARAISERRHQAPADVEENATVATPSRTASSAAQS